MSDDWQQYWAGQFHKTYLLKWGVFCNLPFEMITYEGDLTLTQQLKLKSLVKSDHGVQIAKQCVDWTRSHAQESKTDMEVLMKWIMKKAQTDKQQQNVLQPQISSNE